MFIVMRIFRIVRAKLEMAKTNRRAWAVIVSTKTYLACVDG